MDFSNATEKVCLPLIIGILTIAFPLLLQSISRIDEKYNTSVLTQRFKKENIYCVFQWILYISLGWVFYHFIFAQYFHWTPDTSAFMNEFMPYSSSILLISLTITLIVILIFLIRRIMVYYDHSELFEEEIKYFEGFKKMTDNDYDVFAFVLNYNICLKDNISEKNAKKVYDVLSTYAYRIYKYKKEFHDRFYFIIEQLNEKLCQQDRKLSPIHNENRILCILLPSDSLPKDIIISPNTYYWLFAALRTQLNYGKTDWVYAYWQNASQYYNGKNTNEEFEEFHLWLAAMVLYKEEYDLLRKIFSYTPPDSAKYPLVPSTFADICNCCVRMNTNITKKESYYSSYTFIDTHDNKKHSEHQDLMNKYLSLLLFRLNSSEIPDKDKNKVWKEPQMPTEIDDLKNWKKQINKLRCEYDNWHVNRTDRAFSSFDYLEFRKYVNDPFYKLVNLYNDINASISEQRNNKPLNKKDVFLDCTKETFEDVVSYLNKFTSQSKAEKDVEEKMFGGYAMHFENEHFRNTFNKKCKKHMFCTATHAIDNMKEQFIRSFCITTNITGKFNYKFDIENAFKAIDIIVGANADKYIIINVGVDLDKNMKDDNSKIVDLEKISDDKYNYRNIDVEYLHIDRKNKPYNSLIVIPKDKLPYIETRQPTKEELQEYFLDESNKIDNELSLYAGVTKAKEDEGIKEQLLNEPELNDGNINIHCLARVYYSYNIFWERNRELAEIKVLSKNNKRVKPSNLKDVKPLPLPKRIKNTGNMQQRIPWGLKKVGTRWGRPIYEPR